MSSPEPVGILEASSYDEVNSPEFLQELLAKNSQGPRAFRRLVEMTHDRFLGFIQRRLSPHEECREVLKDVYLAVYKGLPSFAGKSKLTTWMYSLAHKKICDRISQRDGKHVALAKAHEGRLSTEGSEVDRMDSVTNLDAASDRVMPRNAVEALISKAVESLSKGARQVYQFRDIEGMSDEDTAEVLGITSENLRVQLHGARKHVVEWVQEKMAQASK